MGFRTVTAEEHDQDQDQEQQQQQEHNSRESYHHDNNHSATSQQNGITKPAPNNRRALSPIHPNIPTPVDRKPSPPAEPSTSTDTTHSSSSSASCTSVATEPSKRTYYMAKKRVGAINESLHQPSSSDELDAVIKKMRVSDLDESSASASHLSSHAVPTKKVSMKQPSQGMFHAKRPQHHTTSTTATTTTNTSASIPTSSSSSTTAATTSASASASTFHPFHFVPSQPSSSFFASTTASSQQSQSQVQSHTLPHTQPHTHPINVPFSTSSPSIFATAFTAPPPRQTQTRTSPFMDVHMQESPRIDSTASSSSSFFPDNSNSTSTSSSIPPVTPVPPHHDRSSSIRSLRHQRSEDQKRKFQAEAAQARRQASGDEGPKDIKTSSRMGNTRYSTRTVPVYSAGTYVPPQSFQQQTTTTMPPPPPVQPIHIPSMHEERPSSRSRAQDISSHLQDHDEQRRRERETQHTSLARAHRQNRFQQTRKTVQQEETEATTSNPRRRSGRGRASPRGETTATTTTSEPVRTRRRDSIEAQQKKEEEEAAAAVAAAEKKRQEREQSRRRVSEEAKQRASTRTAEMAQQELEAEQERREREKIQPGIERAVKLRVRGRSYIELCREFCPDARLPSYPDPDTLRRVLRRAMARYHPDRARHLPTLVQRVESEEIFAQIKIAYDELCAQC